VTTTSLHRRLRAAHRRIRHARLVAKALSSVRHPVLAQVVPIRRCNLSCAYCNEYDDRSSPVPTPEMLRRIDRLAALGTAIVELSGGEPLLHPQVDTIIGRIRRHGAIAGLLTNGYLLTAGRIDALNRAGLDHLQISIDNVAPDETSRKSLSVLDRKLELLARHAWFDVHINSVLGATMRRPDDALVVAKRAIELGFSTTVGLIHDSSGQLIPLSTDHRRVFDEIMHLTAGHSVTRDHTFQQNLARGLPNEWHCGAGARYLYVCENGLVHWCSQQRGHPGIPLEAYGPEHLERELHTVKSCAPHCTVSCVHRVGLLDELRQRPLETFSRLLPEGTNSAEALPASLRMLRWMFVTGPRRRIFRTAALRLLRVR
jgi:MoaA/NifB/PqqE/SkfB family radical SAM enzyme